jgi:hypothetical protein
MDLLRENGYLVDKTEYFVSRSWTPKAKEGEEKKRTIPGFRKDLFGFLDAVGMRPDRIGLLGLQVTTASNISARLKKAEELGTAWRPKGKVETYHANHLEWWLKACNRFQIHGWHKNSSNRWSLTIREAKIEHSDDESFSFMWWKVEHIEQLSGHFKSDKLF